MEPQNVHFLILEILIIGGALCYLLGLAKREAAAPVAALCSAGALVLGGVLWRMAPVVVEYGRVELSHRILMHFQFGIGKFSGAMNFLALLFGFCVILYALTYWRPGESHPRFYAFALWAVAGASAALTARHLLVFLLAWELVTLMLYLMVGVGGSRARAGAAKSFSMLGFADVALVLAIGCLIARGGMRMLDIGYLQGKGHIVVSNWGDIGIYMLFLVAALAKAGAVPLHTWVPAAAEHAPIPTMALLPASLDKLLGIVLLARVSLGFFTLTDGLRTLLMVIGVVTIISAVMMAMVQHELKRLLSFHAVSQVGYMVLGIGTGTVAGVIGGLFHMVNNAVYKTLLFLGGGAVESRTGDLELDNVGGLARAMPLTTVSFVVGALAISGVPPLNGFFSKWLVYQGTLEGGGRLMPLLLAGAVLGSALTLASFVKAMHSVFFGERSEKLAGRDIREVGWNMLFPLGILAGLCVALGLAGRTAFSYLFDAARVEFAWQAAEGEAAAGLPSKLGFWRPDQAVLLILIGLALGLLLYSLGRAMKVRRVRPFLAGEVDLPATSHVSGTSFYLTVRELPFIRGLYGDAEAEAFDVYRLTGQVGSVFVAMLRKLHTGVLEVYVTWLVVGVAAVIALLFLLR